MGVVDSPSSFTVHGPVTGSSERFRSADNGVCAISETDSSPQILEFAVLKRKCIHRQAKLGETLVRSRDEGTASGIKYKITTYAACFYRPKQNHQHRTLTCPLQKTAVAVCMPRGTSLAWNEALIIYTGVECLETGPVSADDGAHGGDTGTLAPAVLCTGSPSLSREELTLSQHDLAAWFKKDTWTAGFVRLRGSK